MAMDVGGAKGSLKADINVTPLVDVMLVLLIIMMLVAPMLQKGVDVKLPMAGNTVDKPDTQEQTVVAVDSANQFWVNGIQVPKGEFADRVKTALEDKTERIVLIKGDQDASLQRDHGGDGRPPQGADRGHRPDHRAKKPDPNKPRREASSHGHAHKHFGAEKVVKGETPHASADMNVTPLIDVLLVLLIIFMAALPLTQKGRRHQPAARDQGRRPTHGRRQQIVLEYTADRSDRGEQAARRADRARDPAARHLRDPQGKDDVHRRRPARCATATSSPSSTPPRGPASKRSASSPKACGAARHAPATSGN